jgi:hypothetical protein
MKYNQLCVHHLIRYASSHRGIASRKPFIFFYTHCNHGLLLPGQPLFSYLPTHFLYKTPSSRSSPYSAVSLSAHVMPVR